MFRLDQRADTSSTDLDLLAESAREAGRLAMRFFRRDPKQWMKAGDSPVTEADIAVDAMLRERLRAARPDYGWLSEETADDPARLLSPRVFVVDPIDGTRGFINGDRRWCVSVAVAAAGRPVAAALYAPALDTLFTAAAGEGAFRDGERIAVSARSVLKGAHVAGPKSWFGADAMRRVPTRRAEYVPSLALRFAMVADGSFDAAFASPRSHDWDLAASDLLVHEAGGVLTDLDGQPPLYNRERLSHDVLAAGGRAVQPELLTLVGEVALERRRAGLAV